MRPEECCPGECAYRPGRVRHWLHLRRQLRELAENPRAGLHQLEHDAEDGHPCEEPLARSPGRSGTSEDGWTEWLLIAADLDRAIAAGCRTPDEIARELCPYAVPVDNVRDLDGDAA